MTVSPFTYDLPLDRIAQRPASPPDAARLLIARKSSESLEASTFRNFASYIREGDFLIFNDTKVIPARLFGSLATKETVEVFLLKNVSRSASTETWNVIGRPLKKLWPDQVVEFSSGLRFRALRYTDNGEVHGEFTSSNDSRVSELLQQTGVMPIPPYIRDGRADELDKRDYQTLFAAVEGSIAAPTASLHFTNAVIAEIKSRGATLGFLTLHVGKASIRALSRVGDSLTPPEPEECVVSESLIQEIHNTRSRGGRVIAVGTTVARALESHTATSRPQRDSKSAGIFITPGHDFKMLDGLVTNFHQPGTTHLLLVEALIGRQKLATLYEFALANKFRFLSYGDGMLIL